MTQASEVNPVSNETKRKKTVQQTEGPKNESTGRLDLETLEQIRNAARSGEIEAPAGAEDIIETLRATLAEHDELFNRFQRLAADYQNFQRRAAANEREARTSATIGVVQSVLPVMDHFDLALSQDTSTATAEQIAGGVRMIRDELMRVLQGFGVTMINPSPGESFDPSEHEAMLQQPSDDVEPGHVLQVLGVGYRLGDRVIRPAKVIVAAAPGE
ncbi:MAG: nucleotide exchange factor GrpE [Planctomycetota bacterium]|nr:MAG: nucleotide exchange factor GrpE [Planctomycetota bacterium]